MLPAMHRVFTQGFLTWFGWALLGAAVALLLLSLFLAGFFFDTLKNAVPAGILGALGANLLTQAKNGADASDKQSLFRLDSAIKAYEQAKALISDGNNDRGKWIEAGRCLGHAKVLATGVTVDAHQRVLEFNRLKFRSYFYELLELKTAAFFYGSTDPSASLEAAARESSAPAERNGKAICSDARELDESSIRAVWEAAQWPEGYTDPLGDSFSEKEIRKLRVLFAGLHKFLEHQKQWHSIAGQLVRRTGEDCPLQKGPPFQRKNKGAVLNIFRRARRARLT